MPTLATLPAAAVVDGDLSEYAAVAPQALDQVAWGHRDEPADLSATARVAVHGADLFVAVEVVDDHYVPGSGIAGDHVEVWIADPGLDREDAWVRWEQNLRPNPDWPTPADFAEGVAVADRARTFRLAHPRQLQVIAGRAALTDGRLAPVAGERAIISTPTGWREEIRIPLTDLPRVSTLELTSLAVRVDVIDADGSAAQDALVNATGSRAGIPVWTLGAPISLGDDPWAAQQLGEVTWVRDGASWSPMQPDFASASIPTAFGEAVVGFAPLPLPKVEAVAAPSPARRVDGGLQWLHGGRWTDAPGELSSRVADRSGEWVIFYDESPEFDASDHMVGSHNCAAASDPTWTLARWTATGISVADTFGYGDCATGAHMGRTCKAVGLSLDCTDSDDAEPDFTVAVDPKKGRFVVPEGHE